MNLPVPVPSPQSTPPSSPPPQRIAATYFVGFLFVLLVGFLWLRGAGRMLLPLLLIGGLAYGVHRVVKKVREPIE
jgi:hypothetical protein